MFSRVNAGRSARPTSGANLMLGTRGSAGQTAGTDAERKVAVVQNSKVCSRGLRPKIGGVLRGPDSDARR
jgi:hypothetical protein